MEKNDLIAYCNGNTALEIRDLFKFLYQASFGCEYLAAAYEAALERTKTEAAAAKEDDLPPVEYLPGGFCRVHLKAVQSAEALEKLIRLFILSAGKVEDGQTRLEEGLACLIELAKEGLIPFAAEETKRAVAAWRESGFPPVRHSEGFRAAHRPAYRVIRTAFLKELTEKGLI